MEKIFRIKHEDDGVNGLICSSTVLAAMDLYFHCSPEVNEVSAKDHPDTVKRFDYGTNKMGRGRIIVKDKNIIVRALELFFFSLVGLWVILISMVVLGKL